MHVNGMDKYLEDQDIRLISEDPPQLLNFATFIALDGTISKLPDNLLEGTFLVKVNATTFRVFSSSVFSKPVISKDKMNIQFIDVDEQKLKGNMVWGQMEFHGTLIVQLDTFRTQHRMWKEYWQWKRNRNEARAKLEEQYLFDTKHAMHLMRLLRMAKEILTDGEVIVRRPDAEELLAIRDGSFDYEQLVKTAEQIDQELNELYDKSVLPHSADKELINALYIEIVQEFWDRHGLLNVDGHIKPP